MTGSPGDVPFRPFDPKRPHKFDDGMIPISSGANFKVTIKFPTPIKAELMPEALVLGAWMLFDGQECYALFEEEIPIRDISSFKLKFEQEVVAVKVAYPGYVYKTGERVTMRVPYDPANPHMSLIVTTKYDHSLEQAEMDKIGRAITYAEPCKTCAMFHVRGDHCPDVLETFEPWDGDYEKVHYDVYLKTGEIVRQCWPNAGKWTDVMCSKGPQRQFTIDHVKGIRVSPSQPWERVSDSFYEAVEGPEA